MEVVPYLNFNEQCEEAFNLYHKVLGGDIVAMMRFGDTEAGAHVPADKRNGIMHARLVAGNVTLMGSDTGSGPYLAPQCIHVSLHVDTPAEAERIYAGLSEGGSIIMPLGETFWAARFAMFTDRFGTPWMINCENRG